MCLLGHTVAGSVTLPLKVTSSQECLHGLDLLQGTSVKTTVDITLYVFYAANFVTWKLGYFIDSEVLDDVYIAILSQLAQWGLTFSC